MASRSRWNHSRAQHVTTDADPHGDADAHTAGRGSGEITIDVVRLDDGVPLPSYAHAGDAGIDLHATIDVDLAPGGGRALIPTGVAIAIPVGWAGFVLPRSGLALRHGISIVNSPGLIDAGYRGELKVVLCNSDSTEVYSVSRGDRIAQLVVQQVGRVLWREVDQLDGDDRGGGFGHSGR